MSHLLRQSSLRMRVGLAIVALISAGSILAGPRLARRLNPEPAPVATAVPPSLAGLAEAAVPALIAPEAPPVDDAPVGDQAIALGELTLRISADPWQLSVLDPDGAVLWEETPDEPLGFATSDGSRYRALRLEAITGRPTGGVAVAAATDDPDGRRLLVEAIPGGARAFRLTL